MKRLYFLLAFLACTIICAEGQPVVLTNPIVQISIPKSGTHLLAECVALLTGKGKIFEAHWLKPRTPARFYTASPKDLVYLSSLQNQMWITHLMHTPENEQLLTQNKKCLFFIYRDPRDQIISFYYYMKKNRKAWPLISSMSMDQAILDMITASKLYNNHPPAQNIADLYSRYVPWIANPAILSIKFEDLVGEKGGGSGQKQYETIKKIMAHLDMPASDETIQHTIDHLFGSGLTFRKGYIGEWKTHFTPAHKKAFKEHAGQLLIDLSYENDMNW